MTQITCRLTAKNLDQLRNPKLCNRVWATFTFYLKVDKVTQSSTVLGSEFQSRAAEGALGESCWSVVTVKMANKLHVSIVTVCSSKWVCRFVRCFLVKNVHPMRALGRNALSIRFLISALYIVYLFIYICFPTYLFFTSLLISSIVLFPLRIDPIGECFLLLC